MKKIFTILLICVSFIPAIAQQDTLNIYVDSAATGANNGTSWENAYKRLNVALDNMIEIYNNQGVVRRILIAKGTYYPTGVQQLTDRDASFQINFPLVIEGGYPTGGGQRNIGKNKSILSGNIGNPNSNDDNSYHVLTVNSGVYNTSPIFISGVIIQDGNADGAGYVIQYPDTFFRNEGGGALVFEQEYSEVVFEACKFIGNKAHKGGGIVYINKTEQEDRVTYVRFCVLSGNSADTGAAIYIRGNNLEKEYCTYRCTISGNNSGINGGTVYIENTKIFRTLNSIIYGNSENAVQTSNLSHAYSPTMISQDENNNIDINSLFINPISYDNAPTIEGDYHLSRCSPAVNNWPTTSTSLQLDIDGNSQNLLGGFDAGAYERTNLSDENAPLVNNFTIVEGLQYANDVTHYSNTCENLLATVKGDGTENSISGTTFAYLWVEDDQPSNFVKRHYQITPDAFPNTSTGRVTLYFTQEEFDDFNNQIPAPSLLLPTSPNDENGIANLLIEKISGENIDGTGMPGSYPGAVETIDPDNEDVVWNAAMNRWDISFDVIGFSGFFVKTSNSPLPLQLLTFSGHRKGSVNMLTWETAEEINTEKFIIQRSSDGKNYADAGIVNANNTDGHQYHFDDLYKENGKILYRLKMQDKDGKFTYSKVISLLGESTMENEVLVYPNPATNVVNIYTNYERLLNTTWSISDIKGNVYLKGIIQSKDTKISTAALQSGIYIIHFQNGEVRKLIKQ